MRKRSPRSVTWPAGKSRSPSGSAAEDRPAQCFEVVGAQRRDRHDRDERRALRERGDVGQQSLARPHAIDLVDDDDRRPFRLHDALERHRILVGPLQCFDHEHRQVGIAERGAGGPVHGAVQCALRTDVHAGRIDEGDLPVRRFADAQHAMAGGLRSRGDDAELLSEQAFSSVDLPTLGRPTSATKPLRNALMACSPAPAAPATAAPPPAPRGGGSGRRRGRWP